MFPCLSLCLTVLHAKQACALEMVPGSLAEYFIVSLRCLRDEKMHTEMRTQTHARAHTVTVMHREISTRSKFLPRTRPLGKQKRRADPSVSLLTY